jgi:uncharacterized membrane protein
MKRALVLALALTLVTQSGCVGAFRLLGPLLVKSGVVWKKAIAVAAVGAAKQGDDAARTIFPQVSNGADDVARGATRKIVPQVAKKADDVAPRKISTPGRQATRAASQVVASPGATKLKDALKIARDASSKAGSVLTHIPPHVPVRGALYLTRRYEQNVEALDAEAKILQQPSQTEREYQAAQKRIEKITAEQTAIARLIEKMG